MMTRKPRSQLTFALLLVFAVLLTAIVVGVARHLLTSAAPGVEPASQQLRALLGSTAIFTLGGLPAAATIWLVTRRRALINVRRSIGYAAGGTVASALPGLVVLRLLIWDTSDWLATWGALAALGFLGFTLAILTARLDRVGH